MRSLVPRCQDDFLYALGPPVALDALTLRKCFQSSNKSIALASNTE